MRDVKGTSGSSVALPTRFRPPPRKTSRAADTAIWAVPLAIYLTGRVASGLLLLLLGREQSSSYAPEQLQVPLAQDPPSYLNLLHNWDGQWYLKIASEGYPAHLPTINGEVVENVWAFYPFFPGTIAVLGSVGIPPPLAATLISTTCGAVAAVLLYAMLAPLAGRFTAALTVTAFSFGPTALILQAAYTESMALLEILLLFLALRRKRYGWAAVLVACLALTRPIALPVAAVIGLTWLVRLKHRTEEPFPRPEAAAHAALAVGTVGSFAAWPAICAVVTGQFNGYALTQRAWLGDRVGWQTWLSPIVTGSQVALLVVSLPVLLFLTWVACRPAGRAWSMDLRAWAVLYPLFILAVSRPTTSIFRYLSLTTVSAWPFPDWSARVQTRRRRLTLITMVMCIGIVGQSLWINWFWVITDPSITGIP